MSCAECFTGALHDDVTPAGTETVLFGLPCYVAQPEPADTKTGTVVIISDAFGWQLKNTRALADLYARKGHFRVVVPDFFNGAAAPTSLMDTFGVLQSDGGYMSKAYHGAVAGYHFVPFLVRQRASKVEPTLRAFFQSLRSSAPNDAIGVAGFCWGGKWSTVLCSPAATDDSNHRPLVDAAFTAHPSQLKVPEDVRSMCVPYSLAVGSKDFQLNQDTIRQVRVECEKLEVPTEVVTYDGAKHGFAIRGDPGDERQKTQGLEAAEQAVRWFTRHLTQKESASG